MTENVSTVDEYIAGFEPDVGERLRSIRQVILDAVPEASESISYGMPTYSLNGKHAFFFAGWKKHLSLHAVYRLPEPLESEVAPYRSGTDTLKLPLGSPLPVELIARVITALAELKRASDS